MVDMRQLLRTTLSTPSARIQKSAPDWRQHIPICRCSALQGGMVIVSTDRQKLVETVAEAWAPQYGSEKVGNWR